MSKKQSQVLGELFFYTPFTLANWDSYKVLILSIEYHSVLELNSLNRPEYFHSTRTKTATASICNLGRFCELLIPLYYSFIPVYALVDLGFGLVLIYKIQELINFKGDFGNPETHPNTPIAQITSAVTCCNKSR